MEQSALIQVRVEKNFKQKIDLLFSDLGLDTPTAIRIFLNQSLRRHGLPFEVAKPQPNAETLASILGSMEILPKRYSNFSELLDEAQAEIDAEAADEIRD